MSTAEEEAKYPREEAGGDHVPAHGKGTGKGTGGTNSDNNWHWFAGV